jgi:hypothetical protein
LIILNPPYDEQGVLTNRSTGLPKNVARQRRRTTVRLGGWAPGYNSDSKLALVGPQNLQAKNEVTNER